MTQSLWIATTPVDRFEPLQQDLTVDVAIVGGGITGLTAAYLLKQAGMKVAVLEQHEILSGETGHTTAHLTDLVDSRYERILSSHGLQAAERVAQSSHAAIEWIATFVRSQGVSCGFSRVPAFLYADRRDGARGLREELAAAQQAGLQARWVDRAPLPFETYGAIRLDDQAQLDPRAYLAAVASQVRGDGSYLFERTRVVGMTEGKPCELRTEQGTVRAGDVVFATHTPICSQVLMQTRVAAYRTYAVAFEVPDGDEIPPGLYWDDQDPYHYIRTQVAGDGRRYLIVGGEDHKVGHEADTESRFARLVDYCRERFEATAPRFRWSGQILEPVDGLPYIGASPLSQHFYLATGYSGNGITFGTVAALVLSDLILERNNPWASVYSPGRIKPLASVRSFLSENVDFPACLLGDRVRHADARSLEEVGRGQGRIVEAKGHRLAVFRDEKGEIHAHSPVCPHMGCLVRFNAAERSWDCPCHGSRFDPRDGSVLNGPALRGLRPAAEPADRPESAPERRPGRPREDEAA